MQPAGALSGQPRADEHSSDYFEDSLNRPPRGGLETVSIRVTKSLKIKRASVTIAFRVCTQNAAGHEENEPLFLGEALTRY